MEDLLPKIRDIIMEEFGLDEDEVTAEANLEYDLGADSLDALELGMALEEEFEIEVTDDDLTEMKTVSDVVKFVNRRLQGK
jgi:acyl carrier protein